MAQAEANAAAALSAAGVAYCGRLCHANFWRTATPADVQAELDKGASVDAKNYIGFTPLHFAAKYGNWPAVDALLGAGADINAAMDRNGTPLLYAVHNAPDVPETSLDTIALLLARGANPNAQSTEQMLTPLHTTTDPVVTSILIEYGADVNAQDKFGHTPLLSAQSSDVFALLLANGADVDISTPDGSTALHNAVFHDAESVKLILERGADVNARTVAGETACDRVKSAIREWDPSTLPSDIDEIRDLVCP